MHFKNICPKFYDYKNNVLPEISSKGAGKLFLVKIKKKTLLSFIRIL